jgi:hypothetical protein
MIIGMIKSHPTQNRMARQADPTPIGFGVTAVGSSRTLTGGPAGGQVRHPGGRAGSKIVCPQRDPEAVMAGVVQPDCAVGLLRRKP